MVRSLGSYDSPLTKQAWPIIIFNLVWVRTYRGYTGGYRAIIGQPILVSPIIIVDRGYRDNGKENGNRYIIIGYIDKYIGDCYYHYWQYLYCTRLQALFGGTEVSRIRVGGLICRI